MNNKEKWRLGPEGITLRPIVVDTELILQQVAFLGCAKLHDTWLTPTPYWTPGAPLPPGTHDERRLKNPVGLS
jgi:hypothetical protein